MGASRLRVNWYECEHPDISAHISINGISAVQYKSSEQFVTLFTTDVSRCRPTSFANWNNTAHSLQWGSVITSFCVGNWWLHVTIGLPIRKCRMRVSAENHDSIVSSCFDAGIVVTPRTVGRIISIQKRCQIICQWPYVIRQNEHLRTRWRYVWLLEFRLQLLMQDNKDLNTTDRDPKEGNFNL